MHRETGLITNLRSAYRDMFSFFGLKSTENESDEGQYSLLGVTSKKKSLFKDIIQIKVDHPPSYPIFDK